MKVKLLKRLRKIFQLHERNGKYKVYENRMCSGNIYNQTDWMPLKKALEIRRHKILEEAKTLIFSKRILYNF